MRANILQKCVKQMINIVYIFKYFCLLLFFIINQQIVVLAETQNIFRTLKMDPREIATLKGTTKSLREQLAQLKAEKTRSAQTKTSLSFIKKSQEPTDTKRTKQKNKSPRNDFAEDLPGNVRKSKI